MVELARHEQGERRVHTGSQAVLGGRSRRNRQRRGARIGLDLVTLLASFGTDRQLVSHFVGRAEEDARRLSLRRRGHARGGTRADRQTQRGLAEDADEIAPRGDLQVADAEQTAERAFVVEGQAEFLREVTLFTLDEEREAPERRGGRGAHRVERIRDRRAVPVVEVVHFAHEVVVDAGQRGEREARLADVPVDRQVGMLELADEAVAFDAVASRHHAGAAAGEACGQQREVRGVLARRNTRHEIRYCAAEPRTSRCRCRRAVGLARHEHGAGSRSAEARHVEHARVIAQLP